MKIGWFLFIYWKYKAWEVFFFPKPLSNLPNRISTNKQQRQCDMGILRASAQQHRDKCWKAYCKWKQNQRFLPYVPQRRCVTPWHREWVNIPTYETCLCGAQGRNVPSDADGDTFFFGSFWDRCRSPTKLASMLWTASEIQIFLSTFEKKKKKQIPSFEYFYKFICVISLTDFWFMPSMTKLNTFLKMFK